MNGGNSNTSGQNVATLEWSGTPISVSLKARQEIARDLHVTLENQQTSDIWDQATEPTDKTLIWWPKDPTSGARIGRPKTYNAATGQWEELGKSDELPPKRMRATGEQQIGAGTSQDVTINFGFEMPTEEGYEIRILPQAKVDGLYVSAPANMNTFAWIITGQTQRAFSFQIYNVPTGGITVRWTVEEINSDKY
jgi:hypothetical protein